MLVEISILNAGLDLGPFDIYAIDAYNTETKLNADYVSRTELITGVTYDVPENSVAVKAYSIGTCDWYDTSYFSPQSTGFIMEFLVENGETLQIPFHPGCNMNIDWGDSSDIENVTSTTAYHQYITAGTYNVTINGTCTGVLFVYGGSSDNLTNIIQWGNVGFTTFEDSFFSCRNLVSLPIGPITGINNVTSFSRTFYNCTSLETIPDGLFDYCTDVLTFNSTFFNCSKIEEIPSGLFDYCINVESFSESFHDCLLLITIPNGLFNNCTNATSFKGTFQTCGITTIPNGLFDYNINVTNFGYCFKLCSNLTAIPNTLFNNCLLITSFMHTFYQCGLLDGNAPDLWNQYPSATSADCFRNCLELDNYYSEIPIDWGGGCVAC